MKAVYRDCVTVSRPASCLRGAHLAKPPRPPPPPPAAVAVLTNTRTGGGDQQKVMQELIKSAQRPVTAGKVRRKKSKDELKRVPPRDKSKGFAKAAR